MDRYDMISSQTYRKILEHRKNCPKWGKDFCIECFGMGLTKFTEDFQREIAEKTRSAK